MKLNTDFTVAGIGKTFSRVITSRRLSVVFLTALLVWECGVLLLSAGKKLFWFDELVTFHLSTLQPFSRFLQALDTGVDSMPVGYYFLVRFFTLFPGDPHILTRLPSILGYALALLGVYWFVRTRLTPAASLTAVLLVVLSPFRSYAIEARSYALFVGFLAVSAALWQRVDQRPIMKPLLAICLGLCVASHYYAVMAISAFAVAELAWTVLSRRIRWGVWVAFVVATIPFFAGLPILLRFRDVFAANIWSFQPDFGMMVTTYEGYLVSDLKIALLLMLLFAMVAAQRLVKTFQRDQKESAQGDFSSPELVFIGGLLLYPAFLVVVTTILGAGYSGRYGWPAILGMVFASVFLLRVNWFQSHFPPILGALLLLFAYQARDEFHSAVAPRATSVFASWQDFTQLDHSESGLPIVISSPLWSLEAVQYSPIGLRPSLVQLIGEGDKGNKLLARFIPTRLQDVDEFEKTNSKFVLCSGGFGDFWSQYFLKRGYRFTLLSEYASRRLYVVERLNTGQ